MDKSPSICDLLLKFSNLINIIGYYGYFHSCDRLMKTLCSATSEAWNKNYSVFRESIPKKRLSVNSAYLFNCKFKEFLLNDKIFKTSKADRVSLLLTTCLDSDSRIQEFLDFINIVPDPCDFRFKIEGDLFIKMHDYLSLFSQMFECLSNDQNCVHCDDYFNCKVKAVSIQSITDNLINIYCGYSVDGYSDYFKNDTEIRMPYYTLKYQESLESDQSYNSQFPSLPLPENVVEVSVTDIYFKLMHKMKNPYYDSALMNILRPVEVFCNLLKLNIEFNKFTLFSFDSVLEVLSKYKYPIMNIKFGIDLNHRNLSVWHK